MKHTYTLFILVYFALIGYAQYERPPMPYQQVKLIGENENDTIPYLWYETDSVPEWNSMYNNAYNKINGGFDIHIIDSFIYRINAKSEYFKNQFVESHLPNGLHIVKRNLYNGKLIWQVDYNDKEAGRQEMLMTSRINDRQNIEIIGYRRARTTESNNFQYGIFGINDQDLRLFFREYDGRTGDLLRYYHPDSLDSDAAVLRETTPTNNTLLFFSPLDTTIRYFEAIKDPGIQGVLTFLLNRQGHRISKIDTLRTNEPQQDPNVLLTKDNKYIIVEDNFSKNKIIYHFFDLNMVKLKTIENKNITQKGKLLLDSKKQTDFIEMRIIYNNNPPTNHWETFGIFTDLEGNVQDTFRVKGLFSSRIYDQNRNLITHNVVFNDQEQRWVNEFWIRPEGEDLRKFKMYTAEDDYYAAFRQFTIYDSLLILPIYEKYNNFDSYDASSMMVVRLKDFGLTLSSNLEVAKKVDWTISPNPCIDFLDITFKDNQNGLIKIYDITGRLITSQKIEQHTWIALDTAPWQPGMYIVQYVDSTGNVASKKVVKE